MKNIQSILQQHSFEVQGLLRRYKVAGDLNMDTIKKAYDTKGEPFMMDLLKIITPTSHYDTDLAPDWEVALGTTEVESQSQEKGWGFWDKLLNYVTKTSDTVNTVKKDIYGEEIPGTGSPVQQETGKSNLLIWLAAGFIIVIAIILLFKK